MVSEEIKQEIKNMFDTIPLVGVPTLARHLKIPNSRARQIIYDLEVEGFLVREQYKKDKNTMRLWKLKKVDVVDESEIFELNTA